MLLKARKRKTRKNIRKKSRQQSPSRKKKLTLKRAAKAVARMIWLHLVKLPEEERERQIASVERALAKKLARLTGKKPGR